MAEDAKRESGVPAKAQWKLPVIADLNIDPPESEGEDCSVLPQLSRRNSEEHRIMKVISSAKEIDAMEVEETDQQCHGSSVSREEKVSSLKAGLVLVSRKFPKNAHSHFLLGLMYLRSNQPQKAASALEKASEILLGCEEENRRPELLSLVQFHHAQCILQAGISDGPDKELESEEIEDIFLRIKESLTSDSRNAGVWSTLGFILLKTGRFQSAISILSYLLNFSPVNTDALANLGVAYLQSGNLELAVKCFQELALKDQHHPAALVNYAALLLCRYGSVISGPGAAARKGAFSDEIEAANVAKECLVEAAKADSKSATIWVNLSHSYYTLGDYKNARECLEQAAKSEPNIMSTRFAIAVYRVKDVERTQDPDEYLSWAANEMTSILKDGDHTVIDIPISRAGVAMVHRADHEISTCFVNEDKHLKDKLERAQSSLKQAIEADPDDSVQWHQLGLHSLCSLQLKDSQKYLKAALSRSSECSYAWANLGTCLQLSGDAKSAEKLYKKALSLATARQVHGILSNMGNLYRQQKRREAAKSMLEKSIDLCPEYAPALNNLGLVYATQSQWDDAISCFKRALAADPMLDCALSNMVKVNARKRQGTVK